MLKFLASLKAAFWFFVLAMFFMFVGTLVIPERMHTYTGILDVVLIQWISTVDLQESWWVLGIVLSMALLCISTVVCSAAALARHFKAGRLGLKVVSPHIVHLGVLIMLLGHLLASLSGVRAEKSVARGDVFHITDDVGFSVDRVVAESSAVEGTVWAVDGSWTENGTAVKQTVVLPSRPAYYKGLWLFVKSARDEPLGAILMCRGDIGTAFLFGGSAVFLLGCLLHLLARRRAPPRPGG